MIHAECNIMIILLSTLIAFILGHIILSVGQSILKKNNAITKKLTVLSISAGLAFLAWLMNLSNILSCQFSQVSNVDYKFVFLAYFIVFITFINTIWLNLNSVLSYSRLIICSILMGFGLFAMHFVSLKSVHLINSIIEINVLNLIISIFVAIICSGISLFFSFKYRKNQHHLFLVRSTIIFPVLVSLIIMSVLSTVNIYLFPTSNSISLSIYNFILIVFFILIIGMLITMLDLKIESKNKDLERLNLQISQISIQDYLTKIPNRNFLERNIEAILSRHQKLEKQMAFLYIDLDRFKIVNDVFGYETGDQLLIAVVSRIKNILNSRSKILRMVGDEFLLIIEESTIDETIDIAQKIIDIMQHNYYISGREINISASIGIALYPINGTNLKDLLINADMAMFLAKEQGKNTFRVFDQSIDSQRILCDLELENDLSYAVERKQLIILYQPKFDRNWEICGVEALIRWEHPKYGRINPEVFVTKAEKSGLIISIGYWVLQQACQQIHEWESAGKRLYPIAVNLSALQFEHKTLFLNLERLIEKYKINPQHLALEITETTAMRHIDLSIKSFERLRNMGIKIAIDDFGTGYSSFSYLKNLPVDELKIDKEFIVNLVNDSKEEMILASIIDLATKLGLIVTAEGIETIEQAEILLSLGCQQLQGFLFTKPISAFDLEEFKFSK